MFVVILAAAPVRCVAVSSKTPIHILETQVYKRVNIHSQWQIGPKQNS